MTDGPTKTLGDYLLWGFVLAVMVLGPIFVVVSLLWKPLDMANWGATEVSSAAQVVLVAVGLSASMVAWTYTRETKGIREQTQQQVNLLKEQLQIIRQQENRRVTPFVAAVVGNRDYYIRWSQQPAGDVPASDRYWALVRNISPNLALNISVAMYDVSNVHFVRIQKPWDIISAGLQQWGELNHVLSADHLLSELESSYGIDAAAERRIVAFSTTENYLLVTYQAIDGQPYAYVQTLVTQADSNFSQGTVERWPLVVKAHA